MLHPPVSGTNATGRMLRLDTAAPASLVISTSSCSPWGGPTGTTMRPPGRSCSISAGGTIRRRGRHDDRVEWRRSGQPRRPSPVRSSTLPQPCSARALAALAASSGITSIEQTLLASAASTAAW